MTTKIIFLCPHAAAKSVTAVAFLTREAAARGLELDVTNAGTEPDPGILPIVRARLESGALHIEEPPRKVTARDLSSADLIVNIGCDPDELPTSKPIHDWTIPDFSDDPDAAFAALENHVNDLATKLAGNR